MGRRVLIGCFWTETNTFANGVTTLDDFRAQSYAVGAEIERDVLGEGSELAGAWPLLERRGLTAVPAVVAWATPRPIISEHALASIRRDLVERCDASIDGVYLALHGAAVARGEDDPEGALLAELRRRIGPRKPIVVSLDCHAHVTARMLRAVDAVTGYRTCPHVDLAERGEQAAAILAGALRGEAEPVCAGAGIPMVTPPELHDSSREPFRSLMAGCDAAEAGGALSAALFPVQPWIDVPGLGWKAVVTADRDRPWAWEAARRLLGHAWHERRAFLATEALQPREAVDRALALPGPTVVADMGDATNGGTPGDSTVLLRELLGRPDAPPALLAVRDPEAAAACWRASPGERVTLCLGTGPPGSYNERVAVSARVDRLDDGELVFTHPAYAGTRARTGTTAVLSIGPHRVVVHSNIVSLIDPALYEAVGLDPVGFHVVQAKSHVSFKAGFARVSDQMVMADTLGPSTANLASLPYRKRPRPLFPFEDPADPGYDELAEREGDEHAEHDDERRGEHPG